MADLDQLRLEVAKANWALPAAGLVTMHSGNASGYDPEEDILFIKPSGMDYDQITPENVVPVRVSTGEVLVEGVRPSVDLPHHLFLYRHLPEVRGVIHTHSNYATAFAATQQSIPLCLTAIADEFGGEIPCAPYVDNEGEHIGEAILKYRNRAPSILMGNHGVFVWGGVSPRGIEGRRDDRRCGQDGVAGQADWRAEGDSAGRSRKVVRPLPQPVRAERFGRLERRRFSSGSVRLHPYGGYRRTERGTELKSHARDGC